GGDIGILNAFLGEINVAGDPRRRGEHEGPLSTVRVGHRGGGVAARTAFAPVVPGPGPAGLAGAPRVRALPRGARGPAGGARATPGAHPADRSMMGRTSTPPKRAGQSLAMSSAWSRSRAWIR